ncbi:uncharacterized protein TNCV_1872761 [Trichonephila clavipes]|nr:uncharacterized protein TNCV_1872761 [Trichonephila clavipes]
MYAARQKRRLSTLGLKCCRKQKKMPYANINVPDDKYQKEFESAEIVISYIKITYTSSSSANPTSLAHADTQRDNHLRRDYHMGCKCEENFEKLSDSRESRGGFLVWIRISMGGRTDLYIIQNNNLTAQRTVRPHAARLVENFLEAETMLHMEGSACSPDLNPNEHETY